MINQQVCLICANTLIQEYSWSSLLIKKEKIHVCEKCQGEFEPLTGKRCSKCSRMLSELQSEFIHNDMCHDCYRWEQDPKWKGVLEKNDSIYAYNPFLKELMALFKYRGDYAIAAVFTEGIRSLVADKKIDIFVPIPLSNERLIERGFNQSEALIVAAGLKSTLLLTRVHSEKQSKKSRQERIEIQQVFQFQSDLSIYDKQILIIDDIYTTGSTIRQAAVALKNAGASQVHSLTVAR